MSNAPELNLHSGHLNLIHLLCFCLVGVVVCSEIPEDGDGVRGKRSVDRGRCAHLLKCQMKCYIANTSFIRGQKFLSMHTFHRQSTITMLSLFVFLLLVASKAFALDLPHYFFQRHPSRCRIQHFSWRSCFMCCGSDFCLGLI